MKTRSRFSIVRLLALPVAIALLLVGCGVTNANLQSDTPLNSSLQACGDGGGMSCSAATRSGSPFFLKASSGPTEQGSCCKVCSVGKACGDSCISRDKACHKPPGCACDK
jgi:hypothetical protein